MPTKVVNPSAKVETPTPPTPPRPEDYTLNARVVRVSAIDKTKSAFSDSEKRVFLLLDTEFKSFDKDGKETTTDTLTIDRFAICQQICKANPDSLLSAMLSFTMGEALKPQLFASAVQGANVTIKRIYHAENELRQDGESTYSHACYTSEIVEFEERINPIAKRAIDLAIEKGEFTNETETEKERKQITLSTRWQW